MRQTTRVFIEDKKKSIEFEITQMSGIKLEKWINKLVLMLAKSAKGNPNINETFKSLGNNAESTSKMLEFIQKNGVSGLLEIVGNVEYEDFEALYDELLTCASVIQGNMKIPCTLNQLEGMVDSPTTMYKLRAEILKLNFDFFKEGETSPDEEKSSPEAVLKFGKSS